MRNVAKVDMHFVRDASIRATLAYWFRLQCIAIGTALVFAIVSEYLIVGVRTFDRRVLFIQSGDLCIGAIDLLGIFFGDRVIIVRVRQPAIPLVASVRVPLWLPIVFLVFGAILTWWRIRHWPPLDHCERCGYCLFGTIGGRCSECGEPVRSNEILLVRRRRRCRQLAGTICATWLIGVTLFVMITNSLVVRRTFVGARRLDIIESRTLQLFHFELLNLSTRRTPSALGAFVTGEEVDQKDDIQLFAFASAERWTRFALPLKLDPPGPGNTLYYLADTVTDPITIAALRDAVPNLACAIRQQIIERVLAGNRPTSMWQDLLNASRTQGKSQAFVTNLQIAAADCQMPHSLPSSQTANGDPIET